jgi:asparagine synthase (glutamine-hydrolysing)
MCGIAGFNFDDKELIRSMCESIRHRGPDDHGHFTDKHVSLGHRRLSILDLSKAGQQPMTDKEGAVIIVYNGEIYNYLEIRSKLEGKYDFKSNTDTEVIIYAYKEYGVDCLDMFNGMFAFCIYDTEKNLLFLARDRLGIKPLYYFFSKGKFAFASELKALVEMPVKRVVSRSALNAFLAYRYLPGEDSILEGFKKVLPGHYLTFSLDSKKLSIRKYWDISLSSDLISKQPIGEQEKKLKKLLLDAVKKRLISDVPLGVFLSGGLDSSMIVGLMSKINRYEGLSDKIKTFSVGFNLDRNYDELSHAKVVSEHFGTDHQEVVVEPGSIKLLPKIIWHLDEPMADPAAIPNFILSRASKKKVTVILTGAGADEVFAGYEHYKFLNIGNKFAGQPRLVREKVVPKMIASVPNFFMNRLFKYPAKLGKKGIERYTKFLADCHDRPLAYMDVASIIDDKEREDLLTYPVSEHNKMLVEDTSRFFRPNTHFLNQVLLREIKQFLPEQVLYVVDRTNMAFSIEGRVPFVDHRIVEFSASIHPNRKLHGLQDKYIVKRVAKGLVPDHTIRRKKQGFYVPIDLWLNKDLKSTVSDILSKESVRERGFFKYAHIQKMLDNYKESKLYYARQLWSILNFEIWQKIYIDRQENLGII